MNLKSQVRTFAKEVIQPGTCISMKEFKMSGMRNEISLTRQAVGDGKTEVVEESDGENE